MGINPTPTNFKTFTFDGENSRAYGVYITGAGVFNAPERNVEMVDIPGRNGAFALDKGNFNNIEVTYPAGIFADTEADFAQAVSDLRNLLCSKVGYVRLEDDYNPNEYRLAIYKSGLDVDHDLLIAGEFELVFECKPQRYLKSGETAISVTSGNTITNQTRFDAKPLLTVTGYGGINISGQAITVNAIPLGDVLLASATNRYYQIFDPSVLDTGDTITVNGGKVTMGNTAGTITSVSSVSAWSGTQTGLDTSVEVINGYITIKITAPTQTFSKGTSANYSSSQTITYDNGKTTILTCGWRYNGNDEIQFGLSTSGTWSLFLDRQFTLGEVRGDSTLVISTVYIDLDIGETYKIVNGAVVSTNSATSLPAELPTLKSGANTITYDNTFTSVEIVPRWWQV